MPDYTYEYTFWVITSAAVAVGISLGLMISMQLFRGAFQKVKEGLAREAAFKKDLYEQGRDLSEANSTVREERKHVLKVVSALAAATQTGGRLLNGEEKHVAIDLPTGQVNWCYSESEEYLFDHLPIYTKSLEVIGEAKQGIRLLLSAAFYIQDPNERDLATTCALQMLEGYSGAEKKQVAVKTA